eukprot:GFUD01006343.1.p1 GENE.GFUD01006343.1~~GFUD01006343.1.p1  ORF type:complete len:123 (-),score=60.37 GFUD01006343.1:108-476(-)
MEDSVNRDEVEKFLLASTTQVTAAGKEYTTSTLSQVGTQLVELINTGLSANCPSADGFKFVVHATVQEQWGQGSQTGARCEWDCARDQVVSVTHNTDKVTVCLVVFFVHIEEQEEDSESGED